MCMEHWRIDNWQGKIEEIRRSAFSSTNSSATNLAPSYPNSIWAFSERSQPLTSCDIARPMAEISNKMDKWKTMRSLAGRTVLSFHLFKSTSNSYLHFTPWSSVFYTELLLIYRSVIYFAWVTNMVSRHKRGKIIECVWMLRKIFWPLSHIKEGHLSPRLGTSSGCGWRRRLQIWRVTANVLNKQSRTAEKGWCSSLGCLAWVWQLPVLKLQLVKKCYARLWILGWILWKDPSKRKWTSIWHVGGWNCFRKKQQAETAEMFLLFVVSP
jgi:hypothetical protein